ncbi:transcriptional regulator GlxA family with amidase domain [Prauserella sediminis]|uniref:Transcriptional regulator GlxA family with amidase domain n=1 Tax=Prauserella sediminis TaxID=577680 RepID=A0A839XJW3_9PSEU|nr:helix-turn-helix domain-containing protein [Prauserella sediminis]MBB3662837.1 transcriptional regulator GlxA family with amidase domain [Prauserella sediminis]
MRVGIHAFDGVTMFHLSVPQMVFDEVTRQGLAHWETFLFGDTPGTIRTAEGYRIGDVAGLADAREADVVVMPSWFLDGRPATAAVRATLTSAHESGATIVGLCLGAIPVVDAGLLGERPAVTHWQGFDLLAQRHPGLDLDDSVLYIDHGDVLTSAGTASGLDACLHLVRSRLGATAANKVARSLVIAPHREGGQAQYIERPMPPRSAGDAISRAMEWAEQRLAEPLPVERLAATAHMSTRTFVRAFRSATGATPAAWVRARRLDEARRLLETSDLPVDRIAVDCGFGSAVTMRQNFSARFKISPSQYRRRFHAAAD